MSDEAAWQDVPPLPLTMYAPSFRGSSNRRIELRVAYDDKAIYLAARFHHADRSAIRAFSLSRDQWNGDDSFALLLDTFNDNENGVRFAGFPLGTRWDESIVRDGEGRRPGDPQGIAWNTFWDLRTRVTDEGWFGEMRIPLSSLRFEVSPDGSVVMGLMAYAFESAAGSRWTFPAIPPTSPFTRASAWQDVRLRNVRPANPVYVAPYLLLDDDADVRLSADGDRYLTARDRRLELGGDVKLNPSRTLTLDLTANTDFAAVEADQEQVNLTRFPLFFDEKRQFFQERAGIFSFATGADQGTLFYSRRIGLVDGRPIPIRGGARLVGRVGSWDLGVLDMQTASDGDLAAENFGVFRLRHRILNPNSFVGGMATTRVGGGVSNATYGLDAQLRVRGDDYLTLKWLQTFQGGDSARAAAPSGLRAGRIALDWTRRRLAGFSFQHAFAWSGAGYDPAVGFEPRVDFVRGQSDWNYQWYPGEESFFRRIWLGLQSSAWLRNADRRMESGRFQPFLTVESKPGAVLTVSWSHAYEELTQPLVLSANSEIPPGAYHADEGTVEYHASAGSSVQPGVTLTAGDFYDGSHLSLSAGLDWTMDAHVRLAGEWEWNRLRFPDRARSLDTYLARLRAHGALNVRLSLDALLQYNSLTDRVSTNARLRYNFREGEDLWLVWNQALNVNRDPLDVPRPPLLEARTLTLKYVRTIAF